MADTTSGKNDAADEQANWEFEDEEAGDYEWEYDTDEEEPQEQQEQKSEAAEQLDLDSQELPDPFIINHAVERQRNGHSDDTKKTNDEAGGDCRKHKKHHKKSRHLERMELFKKKDDNPEEQRKKKIHVRSKDPSRIARQFEKSISQPSSSSARSKGKGGGKVAPPPLIVNQNCKICGKEPYVVERVVAEKSWWHKNCFRCKACNKALNLDTYMSHEGVLYCKPHHRELFQPKVVVREHNEPTRTLHTHETIDKHKSQASKMETIIRENKPLDLGEMVVKSGQHDKYAGLENLDVGSKYRMFEESSQSPERYEGRAPASDRFGIMEKLKRLQDGEDLDNLLAEIDEELPSSDNDDDYDAGLTNVQRKTQNTEKLFSEGGSVRREKMADERRKELKCLRQKLMAGTKDNAIDQFDDLLNASANKIKKTKVDVRSENAKKFREMFDKGQVPEGFKDSDKHHAASEKDAELEMMRKGRREQRDFFKRMESGQLDEEANAKPPKEKLLVGKLKDSSAACEEIDEDMLEMAPLANRFSFFENFKEKDGKKKVLSKDGHTEVDLDADSARKECKARSILNKFKEMEQKALNGEPEDVTEKTRPTLKRFTPPRRIGSGNESDSEYSDSDTDYSYSDSSYTSSSYSSDYEDEDETLKAIRAAARAKELRAKFEEWEQSQDARDQLSQMMIYDENGDCLETATNLRAKFEALQMFERNQPPQPETHKFKVKRFK